MIVRVSLVFVLLVTVQASAGMAEVLYALASPNEEELSFFGRAVSGAGDVNGDGFEDVVVGAHNDSPGSGPDYAGRAYLFDGRTGELLHTLVSPNEEESGHFGFSVSRLGDVNGNGYDDVVVGAHREDPGLSPSNAGRAYVFDGWTGTVLYTLVSPNEEPEGYLGHSVSNAGDVNGDEINDAIVGAVYENPGSSPLNAGRAYVFNGQTGALIHTLVSPNEQESANFGKCVSGGGDADGDGYDDLIVGAWSEDSGGGTENAGRVYVFSGLTGALMHTLVSPNEQENGAFGWSVSGTDDVNGNGFDDMLVGAIYEDPGASPQSAGRAYLFDGLGGNLLQTFVSADEEVYGWFGNALSGFGDVSGDGYSEVLVAANYEDPGSSPTAAGRAYLFDGSSGVLLHTLVSPNEEQGGYFGEAVSIAGDLNGDGFADLLIGAYQEDPGPSPDNAGRAYVFSWMHLSSNLSGNALELQWSTWSPATEYWIYGADNRSYFEPGFAPGYQHKLDEVTPPTTTWSNTNGIADPDHNWTYLVIAVSDSENELARSNYGGEYDFAADIP